MVLGVCELGLSFRAVAPLKPDGPVHFSFVLDGKTRLDGIGEVAWTEDDGKTGGLRFSNVSRQFRESLRAWFADDASPKNAGREYTPAAAPPLDSIDKIKSSIREGKTDAIKASVPHGEELLVEVEPPKVNPEPVHHAFQKPIVPSLPERPPVEAVSPPAEAVQTPAVAPSSDSSFALPTFRLPSSSPPPPFLEPAVAPPAARPPLPHKCGAPSCGVGDEKNGCDTGGLARTEDSDGCAGRRRARAFAHGAGVYDYDGEGAW